MLRIAERSLEAGWGHHQRLPLRVYDQDQVQQARVETTRNSLREIVEEVRESLSKPRKVSIMELGCGTGDISGPFSNNGCSVRGIDVATQQVHEARRRFPAGNWIMGPAEYFASGPWDVLVMCEFLEHVEEPQKLAKKWMAWTNYALISHPLNEAKDSRLSGGDHVWSYDEDDFAKWFSENGFDLLNKKTFQMGAYEIVLGWGKKNETKKGRAIDLESKEGETKK